MCSARNQRRSFRRSEHAIPIPGSVISTIPLLSRCAFPRIALRNLSISYYGNSIDSYAVVGTEGNVVMSPGYMYGVSLEQQTTIGQKQKEKSFKNTDHFGGEMKYFSDCILNGTDPEPDGEEGYADVRVLEGILRALKSGRSETLEPFAAFQTHRPLKAA